MITTVVAGIGLSPVVPYPVVLLKEVQGDRHLPISIGDYEAQAIALGLQPVSLPRPLPYDLMLAIIGDLGGAVDRVLVAALAEGVFYARIVIRLADRSLEIDARPSDAIALAVRSRVPILVDEAVMAEAGVALEGTGAPEAETPGAEPAAPVDDERLSAFREFVDTLDLDDLDRERGT